MSLGRLLDTGSTFKNQLQFLNWPQVKTENKFNDIIYNSFKNTNTQDKSSKMHAQNTDITDLNKAWLKDSYS